MEKKAVVKMFKTQYKLAKACDVHLTTVMRWRRWIPGKYHERIRARPEYRG
jgi:hypothetical protein